MFAYQEEQAWVKMMANEPDSNYNVIHLNASLYSFIEDTDFEYVNENITIENKSYHIFKKRIKNNILSLYYLRNKHNEVISNEAKNIIAIGKATVSIAYNLKHCHQSPVPWVQSCSMKLFFQLGKCQ